MKNALYFPGYRHIKIQEKICLRIQAVEKIQKGKDLIRSIIFIVFAVFTFLCFLDIMGTKCSSGPVSRSSPWSWKSSRLSRATGEDQEGQDGRGPGGDEDQQLPSPPREEVSSGEST